ncbi:MAG TPA: biopolymer transporter ExbB [Paracoccaceae bacterium]|nr:biopolymer transporter ExbB [Paracoccaceae bacterium]
MAKSLILDRETDPHFSQPVRQIITMVLILALVIAGVTAIYVPIRVVFEANLVLTGFIAFVFLIGVLSCFWQVLQLTSAVSWIEGFALDRPGHEFTRAPRLLASLSVFLRGKESRRLLTAVSTRSILDSVSTRLDEARDITRYITSLLIFLGLLGTFWGLALTMPKVVEVIQSLRVTEGESGVVVFERLMEGLRGQLQGIGTAFSASLVGLAGSLVVGLLDLFAGHAQNRFFRELEEWLASITRIGFSSAEGEGGGDTSALAGMLEQTALQIETLEELVRRSEDRRTETDGRLAVLAEAVGALVHQIASERQPGPARSDDTALLERIANAQERMTSILKERDDDTGQLDAETRMRLRNIDVQLLRILEEMAAGRQDSVAEIRAELNTLTRTIASAVGRTAERQG